MPYATVNGIELYYEDHGRGHPLILAHGAGGNHLSWWQQIPQFSRHYRTITYDHRGWGLSLDTDDRGAEAFVEDLRGLLDHLQVQRALLVGQSMGGFSCLGFTLEHPGRVAGLIMSNTFAGMRREVWLASDDGRRESVRAVWDRRRQEGIKRALGPGFAREHKERAFLYRQIRLLNEHGPNRLHSETQIARLRALERSAALPATRERLATLEVPVLFIGGEHDEVMPVSLMEVAHGLVPSSRMVVVPGTGHSVYFEAPEIFSSVAMEFFATCLDVTP